MNGSGGPTGPATVIVQGGDQSNASYAQSSVGGSTRSDAGSDASSDTGSDRGFGAGSQSHEPAETLNDTFHYPSSS